jgi:hypothetical protein
MRWWELYACEAHRTCFCLFLKFHPAVQPASKGPTAGMGSSFGGGGSWLAPPGGGGIAGWHRGTLGGCMSAESLYTPWLAPALGHPLPHDLELTNGDLTCPMQAPPPAWPGSLTGHDAQRLLEAQDDRSHRGSSRRAATGGWETGSCQHMTRVGYQGGGQMGVNAVPILWMPLQGWQPQVGLAVSAHGGCVVFWGGGGACWNTWHLYFSTSATI